MKHSAHPQYTEPCVVCTTVSSVQIARVSAETPPPPPLTKGGIFVPWLEALAESKNVLPARRGPWQRLAGPVRACRPVFSPFRKGGYRGISADWRTSLRAVGIGRASCRATTHKTRSPALSAQQCRRFRLPECLQKSPLPPFNKGGNIRALVGGFG